MKKIALIPIAAVLGIGVGVPGALYHTNAVQAKRSALIANQQKAQQLQKKQNNVKKKPVDLSNKDVPVNAKASNNQITVKIKKLQTGQLLTTGGKKAKNRYVVIRLSIKNIGSSALVFNRNDFKLKSSHGTVEASPLMTKGSLLEKSVTGKPLAVGDTLTGYIAFDTAGADDKDLKLLIGNSYNNAFARDLTIPLTDNSSDDVDNDSDADAVQNATSSDSLSDNTRSSGTASDTVSSNSESSAGGELQ